MLSIWEFLFTKLASWSREENSNNPVGSMGEIPFQGHEGIYHRGHPTGSIRCMDVLRFLHLARPWYELFRNLDQG